MRTDSEINRRDLIVKTAGAGAAGALAEAGVTPALADTSKPPPGFVDQVPLRDNWSRQLHEIVDIKAQILKDAPDLADPAGCERHRIYCYLLMKLITRFWNGNKRGPLGKYPLRAAQIDRAQTPAEPPRYRGDLTADASGVVSDRYLGHNIACIAVDGNGEVIDFDFNHNNFFRSSAEHAESRMVRRLFSLTDIFDSWKISLDRSNAAQDQRAKPAFGLKPHAAALTDVTLYTSLESCAQCSGVMSLAGIKQIVYMQNDFTAYKIGNLMYVLANRMDIKDAQNKIVNIPGAPIPISGPDIGLTEFKMLNDANLDFAKNIVASGNASPPNMDGAFFVPERGEPDFFPSITSFLCTDAALKIFQDGGNELATVKLGYADWKPPGKTGDRDVLTNAECLAHANEFYAYADIEGYRGSPHKL
jgi:tRNA(Arg) A34 adenosine deaminase TadA